ncbi:MAG: enoyl-CoA hydratase/isomerase family protein [Deltaproteobacteria bacterium]|nr:enoyl-CoA hydratase/isomerase family protein [Deltaproteobacteria bacterium]
MQTRYGDVTVTLVDLVATVEIQRPSNNVLDIDLLRALATAFETLDSEAQCRAIVLVSVGAHFCAGAHFHYLQGQAEQQTWDAEAGNPLYAELARLHACRKPVVGAIQGAAIGGGFGLALVPDFRVLCPETRFAANFVKWGFHPGSGLTYLLPRLIGWQRATLLCYTGRQIRGEEAFAWGLGEVLTEQSNVRAAAVELAREVAANAPLAVQSVRATMREGLVAEIKAATAHEYREQYWLRQTDDHKEGLRAVAERRPGRFVGR